MQVGDITATLLNSQYNPDSWRKTVEPTQKLYSWAMNNHWHTNYRAYQEGPVQFRFVLRPHRGRAESQSQQTVEGGGAAAALEVAEDAVAGFLAGAAFEFGGDDGADAAGAEDVARLTPSQVELVVNLKTAKALDKAIGPSLLLRADEVIQ